MNLAKDFLPISKEDLKKRNIDQLDFIIVTGDAYVDHPSFGTAIIGRTLESQGFTVGIIPQPKWHNTDDFKKLGTPKYAFLVNSGNIDSMVNHYTAAKKRRHDDLYSPGGKSGFRPDRAVIVYCNRIREAFKDIPIVIGGIEASLRRFAHYDYWSDKVRRSILLDSKADLLIYGMGEKTIIQLAEMFRYGSKIGTTTKSLGNPYVGDYELLTDTGARCFPDGFPVAVYLNGEFYGIFSFQLKKHRDNYHMDKSTAEHVHLDGTINYNILWNGTIVWGTGDNGFEVRNPKNLYAIGGNKYDADIKQEEIAGEDEVNTWIAAGQLPDGTVISSKIKKNLQMTAKVKKYIQDFANSINVIKTAESIYNTSSKTEEDLKALKTVFEKYYDVENLIDYIIGSDLIKNSDGFSKNWQWFTYDGIKWWVGLYDCDMSFGGHSSGNQITPPLTYHVNTSDSIPTTYIIKYYKSELTERYKQLADLGIASAANIFELLQEWCMSIGTDFFKEEFKKWSNSPCIADSVVRSEYWEIVLDSNGKPQTDTSETFDATQAYSVDDVVSFGLSDSMGYFKYKCIKATAALSANTPHAVSAYSPISIFKHCDNIYRAQKWIEKNIENLDRLYNYTRI